MKKRAQSLDVPCTRGVYTIFQSSFSGMASSLDVYKMENYFNRTIPSFFFLEMIHLIHHANAMLCHSMLQRDGLFYASYPLAVVIVIQRVYNAACT